MYLYLYISLIVKSGIKYFFIPVTDDQNKVLSWVEVAVDTNNFVVGVVTIDVTIPWHIFADEDKSHPDIAVSIISEIFLVFLDYGEWAGAISIDFECTEWHGTFLLLDDATHGVVRVIDAIEEDCTEVKVDIL